MGGGAGGERLRTLVIEGRDLERGVGQRLAFVAGGRELTGQQQRLPPEVRLEARRVGEGGDDLVNALPGVPQVGAVDTVAQHGEGQAQGCARPRQA